MSSIVVTERAWMSFTDGENFTIRAQKVARDCGLELIEGDHYRRDRFVGIPGFHATQRIGYGYTRIQENAIRASYYTSVVGDDQVVDEVREGLWRLGFNARVFKKGKQEQKAKGVDIALTKDMLGHAFLGNYEVAVLIAGDGDYVPLVEEVKRLGKRVYLLFFQEEGLNPALRLASDEFLDLTSILVSQWKSQIAGLRTGAGA